MKGFNDKYTSKKDGSRGTKLVTQTGADNSGMGSKGKDSLSPKMKGGASDLSHSVKGGNVPRD